MGIFDKFRKHGDQVEQGLDKAAQVADEKTGGGYSEQIRSAREQAGEYLTGQGERGFGQGGEAGGEPGEGHGMPSDTEEGTSETGEPGEWGTASRTRAGDRGDTTF